MTRHTYEPSTKPTGRTGEPPMSQTNKIYHGVYNIRDRPFKIHVCIKDGRAEVWMPYVDTPIIVIDKYPINIIASGSLDHPVQIELSREAPDYVPENDEERQR